MTPRQFSLLAGIAFVVIGVLGFVPGLTTAPHAGDPSLAINTAHGRLFGLFPVNAVHNLVHLALGFFGLMAYAQDIGVTYARAIAVVYGVLMVFGLLPGLSTLFGLAPIYGHDVWLHGFLAAVAAYFGWAAAPVHAPARARV
jgi:hypothetical protein